jgi:hydroxyacylglutathione hydrolase
MWTSQERLPHSVLLRYFYDDNLAQASYMLGCSATGEALIVDPARDISPYLQMAEEQAMQICHVVETHIHADYISGGRELMHRTRARLYLSGMGVGVLAYEFPQAENVTYVHDGDHFMVGKVRIDILHTPGHTPEHVILQVTDRDAPHPIGLFTGDCLFVGDVGRPDLLEKAVKIANTQETGARQQFANVQRLKSMPDYLQIWPGHGAGSACGKALGAVPSTTLGYEKLLNPAFQFTDEAHFVEWLLDGQPEPPRYFAQMKTINRVGAALVSSLRKPVRLDKKAFDELLHGGELVIDTRPCQDYAAQYIPGTLNIPCTSDQFSTYAGWYVDYDRPTYLVAADSEVSRLVNALRAIGVDNIPGYFTPEVIELNTKQLNRIDPKTAAQYLAGGAVILDVRGQNERAQYYIPGSVSIPMGYIRDYLSALSKDQPIITQCGSGTRSQIVASLLLGEGYDVANLDGGIEAWIEAGLAVTQPTRWSLPNSK